MLTDGFFLVETEKTAIRFIDIGNNTITVRDNDANLHIVEQRFVKTVRIAVFFGLCHHRGPRS
jgi:hypothetical protein